MKIAPIPKVKIMNFIKNLLSIGQNNELAIKILITIIIALYQGPNVKSLSINAIPINTNTSVIKSNNMVIIDFREFIIFILFIIHYPNKH